MPLLYAILIVRFEVNMIDIVLCTDEKYVITTGVLIKSITSTNKSEIINFHIVTEYLSEKSKKQLQGCALSQSFFWYTVDSNLLKNCPVRVHDHITLATYYRIFFPTILPSTLSKVLYIDGDITCIDSIKDLFDTDLENFAAGVVPDIYNDDIRRYNRLDLKISSGYFNAGVMLINLDYWRQNDIQNITMEFITEHNSQCIAHDQDALNVTLSGKTTYLDPRYNMQLEFWGKTDNLFIDKKYFPDIEKARNNPCLLHYTGAEKPWHYECKYPLRSIWWFFLNQTQWKGLRKQHNLTGKKRFVFSLKNIFSKLNLCESNFIYDTNDNLTICKNSMQNLC